MTHRYSVRPHLLEEAAIREAILETGLQFDQRGLIVAQLTDKYTVDLDLLASTFASLGDCSDEDNALDQAA